MTGTQERAVAAMRAIGGTVTGAPPPLRLPPEPPATRSRRPAWPTRASWRLWLVPAAAAAAVVAVAVSLVLTRSVAKEPAATPGGTVPAAGSPGTGTVPPYFVTLPVAFGWYAYAPLTQPGPVTEGLVVGSTATGRQLAKVTPPQGLTFNAVSGAADGRTFVVGAVPSSSATAGAADWPETWYRLRISPGQPPLVQLTRLPVPAVADVTGAAVSPDGTELAVTSQQRPGQTGAPASGSPQLTVWSTATGQALRQWATRGGQVTASAPSAKFVSDALDSAALDTALRWTPDGELAFAWNGSAIRLLDLAAGASRNGDLVRASTLRAATLTTYAGTGAVFTCTPSGGWSLSTGAAVFTCAGSFTPAEVGVAYGAGQTPPAFHPSCAKASPAHPALIQQMAVSGGGSEVQVVAQSPVCAPAAPRAGGASLGWSSPNGTVAIAMLSPGYGAGGYYGLYHVKNRQFTALPALPVTGSLTTVAW